MCSSFSSFASVNSSDFPLSLSSVLSHSYVRNDNIWFGFLTLFDEAVLVCDCQCHRKQFSIKLDQDVV